MRALFALCLAVGARDFLGFPFGKYLQLRAECRHLVGVILADEPRVGAANLIERRRAGELE